jgi:hypothetical protein
MSGRRVGFIVAVVVLVGLVAMLLVTRDQSRSEDEALSALGGSPTPGAVISTDRPERLAAFVARGPAAWAADPKAAELARRVAFARRVMLTDGYEKGGRRDPQWDRKVRALIDVQIAAACDDPATTGDSRELRMEALRDLPDPPRQDVLVQYIAGRRFGLAKDAIGEIANHVGAARACAGQAGYSPYVRALALFRGAACAGLAGRDPRASQFAGEGKAFVAQGMALLPEVFADADIPTEFVALLFEAIGLASIELEGDRRTLLAAAARVADQGRVAKAAVMAATGEQFTSYAWDARGGGYASTVSDAQFAEFGRRVGVARAALERAWALDPKDPFVAKSMIVVCMAQSAPREEMEAWYGRATALDPYDPDVVSRKLTYLEPKWLGTVEELVAFGRELLKEGLWETGRPLAAVEAHLRAAVNLGTPERSTHVPDYAAYFKAHPEAWADVKAASEGYLSRFPDSLYHRTRYACIAAWCEEWDEANRQFARLGDRPSVTFTDVATYQYLKAVAAARRKGG